LQNIVRVAAGGYHTCALTAGGGVKCWGWNESGQLGDGTTTDRSKPVNVSVLSSGVTAIAAGLYHTCALTAGGGVKCWGANYLGQLGDGTTTQRNTPVEVSGLSSGVSAIAADGLHTCALTAGGGVKCWGQNVSGQLGDSGTYTERSTPVDVSGLSSGVTAIAAGGEHTCALTAGGGVKCWGANYLSQLGDGTTTDRGTPVNVSGLRSGVTAIATGSAHTCALTAGGGVKCWGANYLSQLGNGTTTDRGTPVNVSGLSSGVTAIAAGYDHTCALTTGGGVKCWGDNGSGQLGDGTTTDRSTPVNVSGLSSGVTAIAAGGGHTCAMTAGGGVKCWGDNRQGQLGDGTTTQRSTPVNLSGLSSGVTAITTGSTHTCALLSTAKVKCWGSDSYGQLGLGTITRRTSPVDVIASIPPTLSLNYTTGKPGSYFTLTGENFHASSVATIRVNGSVLTTTLAVSETGSFIFFINTVGADPGFYSITVSVNPSAATSFQLDYDEPLRPQEGGGITFNIPHPIFLPILNR